MYRKSAEHGYPESQCRLGFLYELGLGVEKNAAIAISWYRKSAEQGDPEGQCCLGRCYQKGIGVGMNYDNALIWYEKSAKQGNPTAKRSLNILKLEIGL